MTHDGMTHVGTTRPKSLAHKLVLIGAGFLVVALTSIGLTLWVTWQLEGGAAAVNEAGRMRMQTWRLAVALPAGTPPGASAAGPVPDAGGDPVARLIDRFDRSLALLAEGDPSRPLFVPWNARTSAAFERVREQWASLQSDWQRVPPPSPADKSAQADDFVASIDGFVDAIEHQLASWTAILNLFQFALGGLAVGGAVVMLYAGYLLVLDPLNRLKGGLQRVGRGDLSARVDVASNDEFGELSAGFNWMAGSLEDLYRNLENRVNEKTARLEEQRERLAALYEVSDLLARAASLEEAAAGFSRQVRRIAGADAAAVRWSNETNQRYLLLAGDCLPAVMAEDEHCLLTGDCLCGQAKATARARVIPIRTAAPPPLGHCARAGFETLISVPVRLQDRVLGEIDLFYRHPVRLTAEEQGLLDALASHLANAMEGLRAQALEREAAVADERGLLARELHDSIAQSLAFLKIQVQLLREAVRRADTATVERTLGELDAGLRESTADVRELLVHFRTRTNTEDIEPALRTTLQKFEVQTGLATHLRVSGDGLPLDPDVQVQALHVIQEALSNVRKHARARQVWLDVERAPVWRFEVRDDGCGFDAARGDPGETRVGLRIMRERAASVGAQVRLESAPGQGTRMILTLPARAEASVAAAGSLRQAAPDIVR